MKNREIKFRAYDKKNKRMFDVYAIGVDFVAEDPFDGIKSGYNYWEDEELKNIEVMQFTGLTDKNGVEIFEGDIMGDEEYKYVVVFIDGAFKLTHPDTEPTDWSPSAHLWGSVATLQGFWQSGRETDKQLGEMYQVIGNIHENPEILK